MKKKYCRICYEHGENEKKYTSHFMRETVCRSSPIVCPTVLNNVCLKCFRTGHLTEWCKIKIHR